MTQDDFPNIFEEKAEYISDDDLRSWTHRTPRDEVILGKLVGPGPKLLLGPRGSGKSTYLRLAYLKCLRGGQVLPIYVNYARSFALEPLFLEQANARAIFRQWVLAKIVLGVPEQVRSTLKGTSFDSYYANAKRLVRDLERGRPPKSMEEAVAPSELIDRLEGWAEAANKRRIVLLLDDAAHEFSSEQQREFFGIFRELRSRIVAPKAAVYPGVTTYAPTFHVGHDAEVVEAWMRPDDESYLDVMRGIAERRLPTAMLDRFNGRMELLHLLALASFGIPRGFIVMLSRVLGVEEEDRAPALTKHRVDMAISEWAENTRDAFKLLAAKLPRYKNFVELGVQLQASMVGAVQGFNKLKAEGAPRATVIAISEPIEEELKRILALLEYMGLIRRIGTVSRGVKGSFERYWIHHSLLLSENALALGRSPSTVAAVEALKSRNAHAFVRRRSAELLGSDFREKCTLELPPCTNCGHPRLSAEARYCVNCGLRLTEASVYKELLQTPIDKLPLTSNKIQAILDKTNLRTVQDILLDHEMGQLRAVPYIGPTWGARILRTAEEFVGV
ncbi:hypothetical protein ACIBMZ_28505 [Micromonospora sp. NPDC049900]|uniref:hypothetical protein n=1 Tax=Micromonospora sp. NPDC049900 TaxID=3364275 RepID=UPI0037B08CEC